MPDKAVTLIDLDDIIRTRAGKKAKYIPGFLINGLKRLIHQDFINEYLRQGYVGVDFCEHTLAYLDVKVKVDGLENISDLSRKYTFVSNHPLGAIDGVTLGMVLGICSRRMKDGSIRDLAWNKTFIVKSVATRRDVVPIHFIGQNSDRFYSIAEWCKRLHLKFNLAMLFLPDEMYRSRHGEYRVVIGKPIPWSTFDKSKSPQQWAQEVKEQVYKL